MTSQTFDDYQERTSLTAIYPSAGDGTIIAIWYCALGAAGEAGEIANKAKKLMRDPDDRKELMEGLRKEIGGTLWYLARLCEELGFSLEDIAAENIAILMNRAERGVLHGSGDDR